MKKILYIHGFHGSPNGNSFNIIKANLPEGYTIEAIDWDEFNCFNARQEVLNYINSNNIDLVIGSSLGGFLTLTLSGIPRFVINPCWSPSKELPKLTDENLDKMLETYEVFEKWFELYNDIEERILVKGFFGTHDELLGLKYLEDFKKCYGNYELFNGGHHLNEECVKVMFKDIDSYWNEIDKLNNMVRENGII